MTADDGADRSMDEARFRHLRALFEAHQRRLQELELQKARLGNRVDPHINTEIDDLRYEIARVSEELLASTPASHREKIRLLRAQALAAVLYKEWDKADRLLSMVLKINPTDAEVAAKLALVQKNLEAQAFYQEILKLRNDGLWKETLAALTELKRQTPDYPDVEGLQAWAEQQQQRADVLALAHKDMDCSDWRNAIFRLERLLEETPSDPEARTLLAEARQQLDAWNHYRAIRDLRSRGDWRAVIDALNTLEQSRPGYPDSDGHRLWADRQRREKQALFFPFLHKVHRTVWIALLGCVLIGIIAIPMIASGYNGMVSREIVAPRTDRDEASDRPEPVPTTPPLRDPTPQPQVGAATYTRVPVSRTNEAGHIVFSSEQNSILELMIMDADGANQQALLIPTNGHSPVWSPDNQKIAFSSYRSGSADVFIVNRDGSGIQQLTTSQADEWVTSWSPDGKSLAFYSAWQETTHIYSMNVEGKNIQRLTEGTAQHIDPAWSPDGKRIVFYSNRSGDWEIFAMNSDGTAVTQLTFSKGKDYRPVWSPDGDYIAFTSQRDGNDEIYIMNARGQNQQNVTQSPESNERFATWAPTSASLAFQSDRDTYQQIYVMDIDGTRQKNISNSATNHWFPRWTH